MDQLRTEVRTHAPAAVARMRTVAEAVTHPDGARWWRENAMNPTLHFDLTPGSHSLRTLDAYLRAHGLPGVEESPNG